MLQRDKRHITKIDPVEKLYSSPRVMLYLLLIVIVRVSLLKLHVAMDVIEMGEFGATMTSSVG